MRKEGEERYWETGGRGVVVGGEPPPSFDTIQLSTSPRYDNNRQGRDGDDIFILFTAHSNIFRLGDAGTAPSMPCWRWTKY